LLDDVLNVKAEGTPLIFVVIIRLRHFQPFSIP
jgi:hypothetical protein